MTREQRRERRKAIADAVIHGASLCEAARQFGVSLETARTACTEWNIVAPRTGRLLACSANTLEVVGALFNPDDTLHQIGARFGVTRQAVFAVAKKARAAGIPLPARKRGRRHA